MSGSGPDEGTLVSVVVGDVAIDCLDQVAHIAKGVPADGLLANEREPALP